MRFWQRIVRVKIGRAGGVGGEFSNVDSKGHTISFIVDKDSTKKSNKATIKLYNLSTATSSFLALPGNVLEVFAGFGGEAPRIFLGAVLSCDDTYNGKDKVTTIIGADGGKELTSSPVVISKSNTTTSSKLLKDVAGKLGLSLKMGNGVGNVDFLGGYSFIGQGQDALTEICDSINAMWFINNGVVNVVNYDGYSQNLGYEINAGCGLIGTPSHAVVDNYFKERKKAKSETKTARSSKNGYGYSFDTLLNPYINIRDLIHLSSKTISDYMYIESIRHEGATNGGTFLSHIMGIKTGGK